MADEFPFIFKFHLKMKLEWSPLGVMVRFHLNSFFIGINWKLFAGKTFRFLFLDFIQTESIYTLHSVRLIVNGWRAAWIWYSNDNKSVPMHSCEWSKEVPKFERIEIPITKLKLSIHDFLCVESCATTEFNLNKSEQSRESVCRTLQSTLMYSLLIINLY